MAHVVNQRERFGEIFVEFQNAGYGPGDLRDLNGVGQAIAEMVGEAGSEDLSLVFEAAESPGINDTVAVALKRIAIFVFRFGIAPAAGLVARKAQMAEHSLIGLAASQRWIYFRAAVRPARCTAAWLISECSWPSA